MTRTKLRTLALASAFAAATITSASAFVAPQIPTPANPHPEFPIATDGSPLPPMGSASEQTVEGPAWDTEPSAGVF